MSGQQAGKRKPKGSSTQNVKCLHYWHAQCWEFSPGDQVLALLPLVGSPFQAKFCGPNMVAKKVSDLNYLIATPDQKKSVQFCHVNLLKLYFARSPVTGLLVLL